MQLTFNHSLLTTSKTFAHDIDFIFDEVDAYIPQFVTSSSPTDYRQKRFILGAMFTVVIWDLFYLAFL